ncbi:MAG TPA: AAA family ATPase [Clostridia bacterium]
MGKDSKKPVIIAVVGKGGVGKTSISAAIVRLLIESYPNKKILAIDADPAIGLSTALGVEVASTVDDIRKAFVDTAEAGKPETAVELLGEARYRMFDALVENDSFSFLAIGRPEAAGCYCKVNSYLKEIINMIAGAFDYVVIDGEAGIEQVNRRVMEKVTHLILVSDASRKGLGVARTISKVASDLVMYDRSGLIINRVPDMSVCDSLEFDMDLLACIPDDRLMTMNDIMGRTIFALPEGSEIVKGARKALNNIGIIV